MSHAQLLGTWGKKEDAVLKHDESKGVLQKGFWEGKVWEGE